MNEISIFNFNNEQVRTMLINDEPWFVAKDVTEILGIRNTTDALGRLDEDERSRFNLGRQGEANIVNEYGLYNLVLASRKPEAKEFKRWITHDVLPAIRKTGSYGVQAPRTMKEALMLALEQQEQIETLELETSIQKQQIAELQPKASYYDWVLQTQGLITPTVIAKQYGKSAYWLNELLHDLKVQYKQGEVWLLYQKHAGSGYTKTNFAHDDVDHLHPHTKWTQKGMLFIYDLLKSKGILPTIELEEAA
jgi:prophage antirepressor-like protein